MWELKKLHSKLGKYDVKCVDGICNSQSVYSVYIFSDEVSKAIVKLSTYQNWNWLCNRITILWQLWAIKSKISATWNGESLKCTQYENIYYYFQIIQQLLLHEKKRRQGSSKKKPLAVWKILIKDEKVFSRVHFFFFTFLPFLRYAVKKLYEHG